MAPWCSLILGKLVSPGLIKLIVVRENCNLCLIVQESSRGGCISKLKSYFIVCSFYFMSTRIIFLFLDNLPLYLLWQLSSLQTKIIVPTVPIHNKCTCAYPEPATSVTQSDTPVINSEAQFLTGISRESLCDP